MQHLETRHINIALYAICMPVIGNGGRVCGAPSVRLLLGARPVGDTDRLLHDRRRSSKCGSE